MEFSPIIAAFIAFLVCAISGKVVIPYLHKLKFGQTILDIGPKWHASKQGTPTMGGVMIIFGVIVGIIVSIIASFIYGGALFTNFKIDGQITKFVSGIVLALGMGFIGFIDDYIKVVKKRNLGLTARQKTFLQFLVAAGYLLALWLSGYNTTWIPKCQHLVLFFSKLFLKASDHQKFPDKCAVGHPNGVGNMAHNLEPHLPV